MKTNLVTKGNKHAREMKRQMKRKITSIVIGALLLVGIMFAEYRYIMCNIKPYVGKGNEVYLEIFGQVDEYYAENMK